MRRRPPERQEPALRRPEGLAGQAGPPGHHQPLGLVTLAHTPDRVVIAVVISLPKREDELTFH